MLNSAAKVRVSLSRQIRIHHRSRWVTVGPTPTLAAIPGRNGARLSGRGKLPAGLYRLMVTPLSGRSRSILFHID
jgi:hypothetical protein